MYNPIDALSLYSAGNISSVQNYGIQPADPSGYGFEIMMRGYYQDMRLNFVSSILDGQILMLKNLGALAEEFSRLLKILMEARELGEARTVYISRECAAWLEGRIPGKVLVDSEDGMRKIDLERLSVEELKELIQNLIAWINQVLAAAEQKNAEAAEMMK